MLVVRCPAFASIRPANGQRTTDNDFEDYSVASGYIVSKSISPMNQTSPIALSIAGFDPSGGAGLLADAKTFEACGVYGFGVVSALTWQNDIRFERVEWITPEKIIRQMAVLHERFPLRYVKIGLVESLPVLLTITDWLLERTPGVTIVWDPVLKASAGFSFHEQVNAALFARLLPRIACITPNKPEAQQLFGPQQLHETLLEQSRHTAVYLKGGHDEDAHYSRDVLYYRQSGYPFSNPRLPKGEKHGSGCVLSSALTAQLALGHDMSAAAKLANAYTHRFLSGSDTLLGHHYSNKEYANH
ncbi:MAG: hydroxymethylpyrimidine/phosphomethylpyrimidine kinase [Bacteroidetes bacterium]|nr:hydroxymethylpyrimidine/phosphomethylpyrimidine kinase [Bacteroidota bacterium]